MLRNNYAIWKKLLVLVVAGATLIVIGLLLPGGSDWHEVFLPTTRLLMSGQSPYEQPMFFSPFWVLLPFVPLAFLPAQVGRAILFVIALASFAYSAHRLGGKPIAVIAFLLSPPVLFALWLGSIDWMPLVGFVLPPQIGLFLVAAKPQMGSMVALFWLFETWRRGGWRETVRVFLPATLALVISFGLFGLWPLRVDRLLTIEHNASLWPTSIAVGLALLVAAFRKRQIKYAMAASPCLSPYVMITSWSGALAALLSATPEAIAAVLGLWLMIIVQSLI
jgi:hypothetical protein